MLRQRQQAGLLLGERLGDGAGGIARHPPGVGHGVAPGPELLVEIRDVAERPGREERVPEVAHGPLDAAFFPGGSDRTGAGHAVVMAAQFEEARVETDRVALPLEDGAAQIIVEEDPGHTLQGLEGRDVAAEEALERLIHGEQCMQRPRPAQHQDEGGQSPGGAADGDGPEAAPIDLALLAHQQV